MRIYHLQYPESLVKNGLSVCSIVSNGERGVAEVGLKEEVSLCVWALIALWGRDRKWEEFR